MKRLQISLTQSHNSINGLYSIMKVLYLFTSIYKVLNKTLSPNTHFFIQLFFNPLTLRVPLESIVSYSHIFENNLAINSQIFKVELVYGI